MNKIVLAKKNIHLNKQNLEKFKNSRDEINKAISGIQKQKMMDFIKKNINLSSKKIIFGLKKIIKIC